MSDSLTLHEKSPESVTQRVADELARRFPPQFIADKIDELLNAKMPLKKGEKKSDQRVNERAMESGLKMLALYRQMADNEIRQGGALPPPPESEEETLRRLMQSPAAIEHIRQMLRDHDSGKESAVIDVEVAHENGE